MTRSISDYAVIGDCRTAALVSRLGSIDWLCWPRFDSPAIFASLLDEERGGFWSIRPAADGSTTRRYLPETNLLETRFECGDGTATLLDAMPVSDEHDKHERLRPQHELVRLVSVTSGELPFTMRFEPRSDYGVRPLRLRDRGTLGLHAAAKGGDLLLRSEAPVEMTGTGAVSRFRLRAGESACFSLSFSLEAPAVIPALGLTARESLSVSARWWRRWISHLRYEGPFRDEVVRSALALKLLIYSPSGAIVAAPTTSLPERIGGPLNWDYRYSWLRDASLTARALAGLGFRDELESFVEWLIHSTRPAGTQLKILYDVFGRPAPRERTLPHLAGFRGSVPVRVGNGARQQLQLDVFGEVIDAVDTLVRIGGSIDRVTASILSRYSRAVRRRWREPDEGIWEPRSGRRHHTHSRLLCWVALDRLARLARRGALPRLDAAALECERDEIRRDIEAHAWSPAKAAYSGDLGGDRLDAAVLLMPWYGFEPADSARMRTTAAAIRDELADGPLVWRYARTEEGEDAREGAFGICSFWLAEYLALGGGSPADAEKAIRALVAHANDVGLFGEEISPVDGEALGNFPQGFTHVGLINAALSLEERVRGWREDQPPVESRDSAP